MTAQLATGPQALVRQLWPPGHHVMESYPGSGVHSSGGCEQPRDQPELQTHEQGWTGRCGHPGQTLPQGGFEQQLLLDVIPN